MSQHEPTRTNKNQLHQLNQLNSINSMEIVNQLNQQEPTQSTNKNKQELTRTNMNQLRNPSRVDPLWRACGQAGPVGYCTDSFLDKNRDQLSMASPARL